MEGFWKVFESITTLTESFILMHFIFAFCDFDFSYPSAKRIYICCSVGFAAFVGLINNLVLFEGIYGIAYTGFFLIIECIFLQGNLAKKVFLAFVTNLSIISVSALTVSMVSTILKISIEEIYTSQNMTRVAVLFIVQILLFYIFNFALKALKRGGIALNSREWMLILIVLGLSFSAIAILHFTKISNELSVANATMTLIVEILIILINVSCIYLISLISQKNHEVAAIKLRENQYKFRAQHAQNLRLHYDEVSSIRHDIKQDFTVLQGLLQDGKTEAALEYLAVKGEKIKILSPVINLENDFLNALLNAKFQTAKKESILVICSVAKNLDGIDTVDLCSILGNLLDNAIQYCSGISGERIIELEIKSTLQAVTILVSNTISESILEKNPQMQTSNPDKRNHGYGINSVKSIAKLYSGDVQFYEKNGNLYCQVLLSKKQN